MTKTKLITETILERIRLGQYRDHIPGERLLAAEFRVNFKTANRAVASLVKCGLLCRRRGEGTFVTPRKRRALTFALAFYKYRDPASDPVFARLFFGVNEALKGEGCRLDVSALKSTRPSDAGTPDERVAADRAAFVEEVCEGAPDAILFAGNMDADPIERLARSFPVVVVGVPPRGLAVDAVRRDVSGGVGEAVRSLAARGHSRIAYLTYGPSPQDPDRDEKLFGYRRAVQLLSLGYCREVTLRYPPGVEAIRGLLALDPRPTAVVAAESTLGLAVLRHAPAHGVSIPRDLALISFDDGDVGANTQPAMSSLHAFGEDLGRLAVRTILDRLDNGKPGRIEEVLPCELVERESSGTDAGANRG